MAMPVRCSRIIPASKLFQPFPHYDRVFVVVRVIGLSHPAIFKPVFRIHGPGAVIALPDLQRECRQPTLFRRGDQCLHKGAADTAAPELGMHRYIGYMAFIAHMPHTRIPHGLAVEHGAKINRIFIVQELVRYRLPGPRDFKAQVFNFDYIIDMFFARPYYLEPIYHCRRHPPPSPVPCGSVHGHVSRKARRRRISPTQPLLQPAGGSAVIASLADTAAMLPALLRMSLLVFPARLGMPEV